VSASAVAREPLRAFHGDPAIKAAGRSDEIAQRLLSRRLIRAYPASGNVWSVRSKRLLGCKNQHGYLVATLHCDGRRGQAKLHRVVWIAANGAIPHDRVIDHINGVKDDNRLLNLRAVDNATNIRNRRSYRRSGNPSAALDDATVDQIRAGHPDSSYSELASRFGVSKSLIAQIIRREIWQ
jgi:hypothetical protein